MSIGLVRPVNIDEQMREAYLDYAMSVIVARALPDARDGLKPVQRRILYAMYDMGLRPDSAYKKSARIVGEVLGKYHPHGDQAVYEAMARMAQGFSVRYEIVDGQGNFGSIDGDAPAAMRYTEARLTPTGVESLADIERETVDFVDNFDGSLKEPAVLPSAIPSLLINGASGIAVGMSTSIPPHNLGEVCDALVYMLRRWENLDDVDVHNLMDYIKGPDFPTGGLVFRGGDVNPKTPVQEYEDTLTAAYASGRGKLTVRAKVHIESMGRGKNQIIVSEIPFQINKNSLVERIADLVRDGKIDGISDLRDESDRQGLRIVIECKTNTDPSEVLNLLFKLTPLQTTFSVIMLALVDNEPRTLTLKQALRVYLEHRFDVIRRRSEHDLSRARARAHILEGLLIALTHLNRVIKIIRESPSADEARTRLMDSMKLSHEQATAILDMQLRRLAALEQSKIQEEYAEKKQTIAYLENLLADPTAMRGVIAEELIAVKKRYNDPRRTAIIAGAAGAVSAEDLLAHNESTWVTLTVGRKLSRTYQDAPPKITNDTQDPPRFLLRSNTADILYLIAADGRAVSVPVQGLPLGDEPHLGADASSLTDFRNGEQITGAISIAPHMEDGYLLFATSGGEVKRIRVADLPGLVARAFTIMNVGEDQLVAAHYVEDEDEVLLASAEGQVIRFRVAEVRPTGLPAGGMRGMNMKQSGDRIVSACLARDGNSVYSITEAGMAKSSPLADYPLQGRAGAGVIAMKLIPGDRLAATTVATPKDLVIALTARGRFKVTPFARAPHGPRNLKGDFVGIALLKHDRVIGITQIVRRPDKPDVHGPTGANGHTDVPPAPEATTSGKPSANGNGPEE